MNTFEFEHKVFIDEIDAFGHVNNVNYLKWFNIASTLHCEAIGHSVEAMFKEKKGWIIKSHKIEYNIPVKPYQKIKIKTWIESVKAASALRKYQVLDKDNNIYTEGETVLVWIDYNTTRPERIPENVKKIFGF